MKKLLLGAAVMFATAVPASASLADGSDPPPAFCNTTAPIPPSALASGVSLTNCNIVGRLVRGSHEGVLVPSEGQSTTADVTTVEGAIDLTVDTSSEGVVHATENDYTTASPTSGSTNDPVSTLNADAARAASPSACQDYAYTHEGFKESDVFQWRYNDTNAPGYVNDDEFAVTHGAINIVNGYNDCGDRRGGFNASQSYDGHTSRGVNIGADGNCNARDGYNVVSWAGINDPTILAETCAYSRTGLLQRELDEADIRIDTTQQRWFAVQPPSNCSRFNLAFDVQGVLTHEFGHVFGLGHVSEQSHANLTMSTDSPYCSFAQRTLGEGDRQGLETIYGLRG